MDDYPIIQYFGIENDVFLIRLRVFIDIFYRKNRENFAGGLSKAAFTALVFQGVEKDIDRIRYWDGIDSSILMKRALIFATSLLL